MNMIKQNCFQPLKRKTKKLKTENREVVWKKKTPNYTKWWEAEETFKIYLMIMQTDMECASPVEIFEKLFSDEIYNLIV